MQKIYAFSGPCGVGKSTLANAYARYLVDSCGKNQIYVIHGDDFHAGFIETSRQVGSECPDFMYWADILSFNWECIIKTADTALSRGLDIIIDYVVETEHDLLKELATRHGAELFLVALSADEEILREHLMLRGDPQLSERSVFLKNELEAMPENAGHLLDCTGKTLEDEIAELKDIERFAVKA